MATVEIRYQILCSLLLNLRKFSAHLPVAFVLGHWLSNFRNRDLTQTRLQNTPIRFRAEMILQTGGWDNFCLSIVPTSGNTYWRNVWYKGNAVKFLRKHPQISIVDKYIFFQTRPSKNEESSVHSSVQTKQLFSFCNPNKLGSRLLL